MIVRLFEGSVVALEENSFRRVMPWMFSNGMDIGCSCLRLCPALLLTAVLAGCPFVSVLAVRLVGPVGRLVLSSPELVFGAGWI